MRGDSILTQLRDFFWADPLMGVAIAAAIFALATTPIAFAILGKMDWFKARRGRVMQKPEFFSVVCAMLLVMGIPAIFTALVIKSRYFDKNRYEFDPNRTLSVLDQGRQFETLQLSESVRKADEAVRAEMKRLADERKNLVESVKKLDEAMLTLRAASAQSPATAQAIPSVLQSLARIRKSVGLDGPQQLMDFTAPPVALAGSFKGTTPAMVAVAPNVPQPTPIPAAPSNGLSDAEIAAEIASVPAPQKPLAAMLPLSNLPAGWIVAKSGERHLETFNAENLFEKIDGRAESFIQYGVQGMAYTYYHPADDESMEAQLYIFEMKDQLQAFGKYGSEKPENMPTAAIGSEGYTSAGSTIFYAGKYYTQVVTTKDDPKLAAFALDIAKRVAEKQKGPSGSDATAGGTTVAGPEAIFKLLPAEPKRSGEKYVALDAFGYSFLSDVFMADYQEGDASWQGFLRPCESPEAAKAVFEKYVASVRQDGANIKMVDGAPAERLMVASNIGLVDAVFLKGNAIGGANGGSDPAKAESFARAFAAKLPTKVPFIPTDKKPQAESDAEGAEK
jgi:hypothetical protein